MSIIPSGATKAAGRKDAEFGLNFVQVPDLELEFIHVSSSHSTLEHIAQGSYFDGGNHHTYDSHEWDTKTDPGHIKPDYMSNWACETESLHTLSSAVGGTFVYVVKFDA